MNCMLRRRPQINDLWELRCQPCAVSFVLKRFVKSTFGVFGRRGWRSCFFPRADGDSELSLWSAFAKMECHGL